MKNVIVMILLSFLMDGVFGADEKKEVTDGDSLTLPTGLTQTQSSDLIFWLYGSKKIIIAKIDNGIYSTNVDDERFKGNLELDKQTGSLTIKNIRIKNTGLYELDINRGTTSRKFSVKVYASLSTPTIDSPLCAQTPAGSSSPKCVFRCSVQASDQTTLSWYSGNRVVSSKISDICSSLSLHLEVNYDDKNIYSCMINNPISNKTKHLDITQLCKPCEDPGLSPGAVAGIVIGVLLLVFAAAAAGVIYYHRKISELESQQLKKESVKEGDDVTLNTDTEIKTDDLIEWRFGDGGPLIAALRGGNSEIYDNGINERFTNRLKLDKKTGSLTVIDQRTTHSGLYHLMIRQDRKIKYKMFYVSVCVETVSVNEGDPVILKTDTEIQSDDLIEWRFGDKEHVIADIRGGIISKYDDVADGIFRGRLKLDKTGSLTITDSEVKHAGDYKLRIKSSSEVSREKFRVVVRVRNITVKKGKHVILHPETEIQKDDQILWRFGDKDILIAELRGGSVETHDDVPDERFRSRLILDDKTGSLIITDITAEQSGEYKLQIRSSRRTTNKTFVVTVFKETVSVNEGDSVILKTDPVILKTDPVILKTDPVILKTDTEIQSDDLIEWRFGDKEHVIADIRGGIISKYDDVADGIFRGRLKLDKTTGSLTITDSEVKHAGDYKLRIKSNSGVSGETFRVIVRDSEGNRVNYSATVQMPPVDEEDLDVGNEHEGMSLLVMR